ncbi:MAG: hypothetical protein KDK53_03460 [Maritimibacter sp.]|nr:hypothetical protein [Maritimibacter sp.]
MSDINIHFEVEAGSERNFGFVFAAVFAVVALLPLLGGSGPRWIVLAIAVVFAALALFRPAVLRVPNRLWFKFGMLLGAIIAPVVMGLVFLVAFVPIGLIIRLTGKDLMSVKAAPEAESYWIDRKTAPNSMKLQY